MREDRDEEFADAEAVLRGTVERLRRQGQQARDGAEGCYYRGPEGTGVEGLGCAVGVWLPDTRDVRRMYGTIDDTGVWGQVRALEPRLGPYRDALRTLQRLHDGYYEEDDGPWGEYLDRWSDPEWRRLRTLPR